MSIIINTTVVGEKIVFAMEGRLDANTSPSLWNVLLPSFDKISEGGDLRRVELDFKKIKVLSSAGLRILLLGEKTAKAKGVEMTLVNVSAEIKEIFDMTGFSDILNII
ncbi:MAG: STAS domain-containing protein [Chitinivibrionia bacterium]|nr:STAS domain-containing protein [Chitinivibrionia bacterium]